ncbi:hypothetical protein ABMC89_03310 [Sulfitobacter sp. HNIBRBA3233]|uniref:hypothetical protein n=1 Tax=Sulfitobacter marinivivus TaxID=3158558 RepID=UPI0032DFEBF2
MWASICAAYTLLYPALSLTSLKRLVVVDSAVTVALLVVIGVVYAGSGIGFSLFGLALPWWLYTLVTGIVIEVPLFIWYCRAYGVDFDS